MRKYIDFYYGSQYEDGSYIECKQKYADIEYNEYGEIISYDFSKLDEYIEKVIIKDYVKYKNGESFIRLGEIVSLRLPDIEIEYIIRYLNNLNISVRGYSTSVSTSDFPNYECKYNRDYITDNTKGILQLSDEENNKLLTLYQQTKDINLRNKIFMGNIKLVGFMIMVCYFGTTDEDLWQHGYIGLIDAIEKYKSEKNVTFSTFASAMIKYSIVKYCANPSLVRNHEAIHFAYNKSINQIKNETELSIEDETIYENKILDKMFENDYVKKHAKESEIKSYIKIKNAKYIEDMSEEEIQTNFSYNDNFSLVLNKLLINDNLNILDERSREMVKLRFGFYNNFEYTYTHIGKIYGVSHERCRQIVDEALKKLKEYITTGKVSKTKRTRKKVYKRKINPY